MDSFFIGVRRWRSSQSFLYKSDSSRLFKFSPLYADILAFFFHALIVLLSGLYPAGIPVFELSQGREGRFPFQCFPLSPDPTRARAAHQSRALQSAVNNVSVCDLQLFFKSLSLHLILIIFGKRSSIMQTFADVTCSKVLCFTKCQTGCDFHYRTPPLCWEMSAIVWRLHL